MIFQRTENAHHGRPLHLLLLLLRLLLLLLLVGAIIVTSCELATNDNAAFKMFVSSDSFSYLVSVVLFISFGFILFYFPPLLLLLLLLFLNRLKRWLIASIDSFSSKFGQGKWDLPYSSDIFWSSSLMNSKSAFILRVDILALTRWIRFHRSRFGNIWQRRIAHNQSNRERGRGGGVKFVLVPLQIPS